MDLRSGHPFWLVKNGLLATYPPLESDLTCEVVVIGGGITGALIAYTLAKEGVDVVVLDKREIAWGSTSASTAMLQYEIDKELHELAAIVGKESAVRSYQLGVEALATLEEIVHDVGAVGDFCRVQSIYATRYKRHLRRLETEFAARQANGFTVRYVEQAELAEKYGIHAHAAIVSAEGATVDAYVLTHALFAYSQALGVRIFDRSEVSEIVHRGNRVNVHTNRHCTIHAAKIVFATGYETQQYLKQNVTALHSTFALASEPTAVAQPIKERYLLWETDRKSVV